MDYMPEMIAQLCFLPSGLFMGYIFYIFEFGSSAKLENITYFPYIIGFSAAFLIALLYSAFKSNKRQELYQQFHILVGCCILYIIGGGLFMLQIVHKMKYVLFGAMVFIPPHLDGDIGHYIGVVKINELWESFDDMKSKPRTVASKAKVVIHNLFYTKQK